MSIHYKSVYFSTTEIYINLGNKRQRREIFIATGIPPEANKVQRTEISFNGLILRCAAPDVSIWWHLCYKD
ncbi:MAG: hypothetical protein B6D61_09000 [Bacteroidetes bacterium 4484_249]|nr:MAG: hypothetical protein B6D61_09000 [Bacteroidetes bacterium 4484_249]